MSAMPSSPLSAGRAPADRSSAGTAAPNSTPGAPGGISEDMPSAERLAISRERIRRTLQADESGRTHHSTTGRGGGGASGASAGAASRGRESSSPEWLQAVRAHPLGATVLDTVGDWWRQQPLVVAARVAEPVARHALTPLAQRHPLALIGVSVVAGGLLVRLRPWRWLWQPALISGVAAQLATRVITRLPVDSLIDLAASMLAPHRRD